MLNLFSSLSFSLQLNDTIKERDDRIKQVELELDAVTDKLSETQAAFDEAEKAQGVVSTLFRFEQFLSRPLRYKHSVTLSRCDLRSHT